MWLLFTTLTINVGAQDSTYLYDKHFEGLGTKENPIKIKFPASTASVVANDSLSKAYATIATLQAQISQLQAVISKLSTGQVVKLEPDSGLLNSWEELVKATVESSNSIVITKGGRAISDKYIPEGKTGYAEFTTTSTGLNAVLGLQAGGGDDIANGQFTYSIYRGTNNKPTARQVNNYVPTPPISITGIHRLRIVVGLTDVSFEYSKDGKAYTSFWTRKRVPGDLYVRLHSDATSSTFTDVKLVVNK